MADSTSNVSGAVRAQIRRAKKLVVLATTPRWRSALRHGVAATVEHRDVPFDTDFASVLDVGGHKGQFTLFALERFPQATVTTFEPQADGVKKIAAVTAGEPRSRIENCALGAEAGTAELNISKRSDSSSLLPIGRAQVEAYPGTEQASTETITVRTLDEVLTDPPAQPALLKIDVQGGELNVLRGAERTLASIDAVFAECSFVELYEGQALANEIIAFLAERGFQITGVFGIAHDADGRCLQADFLFTRGA